MENEGDKNGTPLMSHIGGEDKINPLDEFDNGMVGPPYAIAFDSLHSHEPTSQYAMWRNSLTGEHSKSQKS